MSSINKNSYLQSYYKDISPGLINRCVERAFKNLSVDEHDLEPPFQRLTSEQPSILVKNVDVARRHIGFGKCAMPKLRRELHNNDVNVVIAALESISDLIHDPERGYEAMNLRIVDRLVDLMCLENPIIREKSVRTLTILARLSIGKEAIDANQNLLDNIAANVEDDVPEVRMQTAALLEMLSRFWKAVDELVEYGFITILLNNIEDEREEIVELHLQTMASLIYSFKAKSIAMDNDGYALFIKLLENDNENIISGALKCLAYLTSTCRGEKIAMEDDLLDRVKKFLFDERSQVHTMAAQVIMYCTVKTKGKSRASLIKPLTKRLVQLCRNQQNPSTQIFAIKALTNMCEHPVIRQDMKANFYDHIDQIQVGTDTSIKEYKQILLRVINWQSSSST